ncbi:MAG: hypothetical protein MI799_16620, partial [Desulfobacterales bacterium]|nr:hypothetical protein [Desulfobacterales bacterium]
RCLKTYTLLILKGYSEVVVIADLVEGLLGGLGKIIGRILIELVFEVIFYFIGYPVVKVLTFGKYPTRSSADYQNSIVSCVGMVVTILFAAVVIWVNNRV